MDLEMGENLTVKDLFELLKMLAVEEERKYLAYNQQSQDSSRLECVRDVDHSLAEQCWFKRKNYEYQIDLIKRFIKEALDAQSTLEYGATEAEIKHAREVLARVEKAKKK